MCDQATIEHEITLLEIEKALHEQHALIVERKIRLLRLHGHITQAESAINPDRVEIARLNRNSAACALDIANIELAIAKLEQQVGGSELEPVPVFDMIDQLLSGAEIMAFAF